MKKDKYILLILAIIVIAIIVAITISQKQETPINSSETMQCIADNSLLIVSKTCGHCATQKEILGTDLNKFTLLYVDEDPNLFEEYGLRGVPAWIINEKVYHGVRQIKELKELTGCE